MPPRADHSRFDEAAHKAHQLAENELAHDDIVNPGNLELFYFFREAKRVAEKEPEKGFHQALIYNAGKICKQIKEAPQRIYDEHGLQRVKFCGDNLAKVVRNTLWRLYPPQGPDDEEREGEEALYGALQRQEDERRAAEKAAAKEAKAAAAAGKKKPGAANAAPALPSAAFDNPWGTDIDAIFRAPPPREPLPAHGRGGTARGAPAGGGRGGRGGAYGGDDDADDYPLGLGLGPSHVQHQPLTQQPQRRTAHGSGGGPAEGAGVAGDRGGGGAAAKRARAVKDYVPKVESANYAFLITLYKARKGGRESLTKEELMAEAEASRLAGGGSVYGDKGTGAPGAAATWYDGWSSMSKNILNGRDPPLAFARGNPKRVSLLEAGVLLGAQLYLDALNRGKVQPLPGVDLRAEIDKLAGQQGREAVYDVYAKPDKPEGGAKKGRGKKAAAAAADAAAPLPAAAPRVPNPSEVAGAAALARAAAGASPGARKKGRAHPAPAPVAAPARARAPAPALDGVLFTDDDSDYGNDSDGDQGNGYTHVGLAGRLGISAATATAAAAAGPSGAGTAAAAAAAVAAAAARLTAPPPQPPPRGGALKRDRSSGGSSDVIAIDCSDDDDDEDMPPPPKRANLGGGASAAAAAAAARAAVAGAGLGAGLGGSGRGALQDTTNAGLGDVGGGAGLMARAGSSGTMPDKGLLLPQALPQTQTQPLQLTRGGSAGLGPSSQQQQQQNNNNQLVGRMGSQGLLSPPLSQTQTQGLTQTQAQGEGSPGGGDPALQYEWCVPTLADTEQAYGHGDLRLPPTLPPGARFDDHFTVRLLVDQRERMSQRSNYGRALGVTEAAREHLKPLLDRGLPVEFEHLPVGDVLWVAVPKDQARAANKANWYVLDYIIERKGVTDLSSSIRDGRYSKQKWWMLRSGLQRPMYLVEGDPVTQGLPEREAKAVRTAAYATELEGFTLLRTADHRATVALYGRLHAAVAAQYGGRRQRAAGAAAPPSELLSGALESLPAWVGRMGATSRATKVSSMWGLMLCAVPGLGEEVARTVMTQYRTPQALAGAYKDVITRALAAGQSGVAAARALLQGLPGVGPQRAAAVYDSLFSYNANFSGA